MKKRKCAKFGVSLINEDVMKVKFDDESWQVIPLRVCPDCLARQRAEQARVEQAFARISDFYTVSNS